MSRDRVEVIATRYGLDGPGIESWWRRDFLHPSRAYPASYTIGTGSFPGVKRPRRGVDNLTHLEPRLKKQQGYTSTPPMGLHGLFYGERKGRCKVKTTYTATFQSGPRTQTLS